MYHAMNKIINMQTFSYRSQLYSFMNESNEHIVNEVGLIARKFKTNYSHIGKHLKKRLSTAKWNKRHKELHNEGIELFFKLMANVNMAHQHIYFQCNLIYLAENDLLLLEEIPGCSEDRLDSNFSVLIKSIKTFDSSDRSNLLLFNRLRNVLCHTSIKQSANIFHEEFLDELIDLCATIDELLSLVGKRYIKEISKILDANIVAYLDSDEYGVNPKYKETKK